jgi:hypothetical protein
LNAAASAATDETPWTATAYETALLAAGPRWPVEQTAPVGERRAVGDGATFALPGDVLTAGTRDGVDNHVSWQQPVTASTASGRSAHPVGMGTADRVANISSHTDHIGRSNFSNPGRCVNRYDSLSSSRRVVVCHSRGRRAASRSAAPTALDGSTARAMPRGHRLGSNRPLVGRQPCSCSGGHIGWACRQCGAVVYRFDPDDPAVIEAIDIVRWELSLGT